MSIQTINYVDLKRGPKLKKNNYTVTFKFTRVEKYGILKALKVNGKMHEC